MHDEQALQSGVTNRRCFLRGLLAFGYGAFLPSLLGCTSRQEAVQTNSASEEAPVTPAQEASPAITVPHDPEIDTPSHDVPKLNKSDKYKVSYQDEPKNGRMCAKCIHFHAETNTCDLVEGTISPLGWCKLWMAGKT